MHILIIPSEQYVPKEKPLEGIFQKDQAEILKSKGYKIGVLSVSIKYSVIMLVKALGFKIFNIKITNDLNDKNTWFVLKTLVNKTLFLRKYITSELKNEIPVIRIETFYNLFLSKKNECKGWMKGGWVIFQEYLKINGKPDIIHAHNMVYAGVLASELNRKYNIPVVVTEHSSFYAQDLYSSFTLKKINNSLININKFCVVSNSLGKFLKSNLSNLNDYLCLPNVLDDYFVKTKIKKKVDSSFNNFVFINVGSFVDIKRQTNLINAFSLKFKGLANVKLKIIGGGNLKEDLILLTNNKKVSDQVEIIDELTREEILILLDNSDAFVFSSKYETFGVAIIEALSRGLPVISTKCGGPESIVNEKNGILVDVDDIEQMSDAMELVKLEYSKYKPANIRNECIKTYGAESFVNKISLIYKSVT